VRKREIHKNRSIFDAAMKLQTWRPWPAICSSSCPTAVRCVYACFILSQN